MVTRAIAAIARRIDCSFGADATPVRSTISQQTSLDEELAHLRTLTFDQSRIPALDALEVFVPDGAEADEEFTELRRRTGFSRWRPVEGGHQVLILYEGGAYDRSRFALRKGAWDHEHCKRCGIRIEPMTSCWVSTGRDYTILCDECHRSVTS
jgi:hypothetical protein